MPDGRAGLRWGVKRSFVEYIARMPDGRMSVLEGASLSELNELVWRPDLSGDASEGSADERTYAFKGDVRYGGHGGLLFVQLADPLVTVRGDVGEMTVLDSLSKVEGARLHLVTFIVDGSINADGVDLLTASDVRLTEQGAEVFNAVYAAGEQFEPLTITWPRQGT